MAPEIMIGQPYSHKVNI
ncbi:hypothetical protein Nmel_008399 [Mimus melanotis]